MMHWQGHHPVMNLIMLSISWHSDLPQFYTSLLWICCYRMWNWLLSESQEHFLCSYIFTVYTSAHSKNGKYIIYGCIRLRAILWRFYWKDYERCCNSRSVINIMCFDFSIFSVMWNRPGVLLTLGQGFYMILSTGFDISIWTFNVLFDCMTGFYMRIQYTSLHSMPTQCPTLKAIIIIIFWTTKTEPFLLLYKPDFRQCASCLRSVRAPWPRHEPAVCSS